MRAERHVAQGRKSKQIYSHGTQKKCADEVQKEMKNNNTKPPVNIEAITWTSEQME